MRKGPSFSRISIMAMHAALFFFFFTAVGATADVKPDSLSFASSTRAETRGSRRPVRRRHRRWS